MDEPSAAARRRRRSDRGSQVPVLVAGDHPVFRRALAEMLAQDAAIDIFAETILRDAPGQAAQSKPRVVVLGIHAPGRAGAETARRIRGARPGTEVVIVSTAERKRELANAVRAGVRGYLTGGDSAGALEQAVHRAAAGEPYFRPELIQQLVGAVLDRLNRPREPDGPGRVCLISQLDGAEVELVGAGF